MLGDRVRIGAVGTFKEEAGSVICVYRPVTNGQGDFIQATLCLLKWLEELLLVPVELLMVLQLEFTKLNSKLMKEFLDLAMIPF